jgi:hypothetical protein
MTFRRNSLVALTTILLTSVSAFAQDTTIGLIHTSANAFDGYTLFSPSRFPVIYLIDIDGQLVHSWESDYMPGNSVYLLDNGNLLRPGKLGDTGIPRFNVGGAGGVIHEYDWQGNLLWEFFYSTDMYRQHHDVARLPNGNVLILAWEYKTGPEAIARGRDPQWLTEGELWPETIVEVTPIYPDSAVVVWEWYLWDHIIQDFDSTKENYGVVADHPEAMDINYTVIPNSGEPGVADWNHANAVDYNPELDQILISLRSQSEIIIIDHSTTTEEAAGNSGGSSGRGGEILYRWGNPDAYQRGQNSPRKLFYQHDARWIEPGLPGAGNITIYNNGLQRPEPPNHSSIEEIATPLNENGTYDLEPGEPFGPEETVWTYTSDPLNIFYSTYISGANRLPNGNTLICMGARGIFFEVDSNDVEVWRYVNPVDDDGPREQGTNMVFNQVFRTTRFAPDFPGLAGRDLTPQGPIELYPDAVGLPVGIVQNLSLSLFPNPFNSEFQVAVNLPQAAQLSLRVYDLLGREVVAIQSRPFAAGRQFLRVDTNHLPSGTFFVEVKSNHYSSPIISAIHLR